MKQINATAKTMDKVFHILEIFVKIAFVAAIVGLVIVIIAFAFRLDPEIIGTGYGSVDLGALELELAEDCIHNQNLILLQVGIEMLISLFVTVVMVRGIRCIRSIVQPMMDGTPFFEGVSQKLKTLAKYCFILGIAVNLLQIVSTSLIVIGFDLEKLLTSQQVTNVNINPQLDATFLLTGAILLLLSYIFRHGEQLQQLSDETL